MRTFSGAEQFDALKKTVVESYQNLFPVQKDEAGQSLHLKKIWVDEEALDPKDFPSQKKARLAGNTWGAPVYASLELHGPGGAIIDRMDKVRLATIPKLTPRGSYIVNGNEYQVANQLRMKMGSYVVRMTTGDQFKGAINTGGDTGRRFEIHFDPKTNKYATKVGQGYLPLYPLLHALGTSDDDMRKSWGSEVFAANKTDPSKDILKYAERFTRTRHSTTQSAIDALKTFAQGAKLDPHVAQITLGKPYGHIQSGLVLDTSKKLLDVYQGKQEPDDPENILFKEVLSAEDMLKDKLGGKKGVQAMKYILSRQLGKKSTIRDMIDFRKLSAPVESFFTTDDRSSTPEQYNPVHMLSETHKLTLMGTGGITDPHTVTQEIREVHPSHVGFVDPVATPESNKIGVTLHLTTTAQKDGRDIRTPVVNVKTKKIEYLTPSELYNKRVAFPDEASHEKGGIHFKSAQVKAQKLGKLDTVPAGEVEYIFPSHVSLFGHSANLVPFLANDQGTRAMMAAKHLGQAIPLVDREAPLVQTDMGNGKTFHEAIGEEFSAHSPVDGRITHISADHIEVGGKRVALYNNFPLNQKTYLHHEPVVTVGQSVKKGQLLADSNFSKKGVLALGKNLKVAYLPYPGLTFEDGIVITESAAKKLSSQHIYRHTFQIEPGEKITDSKKFQAYYPSVLSKENRASFDDAGVVKKGSVIQPGQPVILGLKYELASPENATLRKINKALARPWSNAVVRYTGEFPGTVTDVVKRAGQVDVFVKTTEPAKESDKISGVHGNKGVITKVIPDHEAPHFTDGSVPDVFLNPHGIISRINLGQLYESSAGKIAEKTGKPYVIKNFSGENINEKVKKELADNGLTDTEDMFLPNGKPIGKIHVGKPYILRLAKTGKSGFSARMPGTGYDLNRQPIKGGEEGTKALDLLTFYSMLSHGAKKNLIDSHQKSEQNDEYWHAIETGKPLPLPKPTFAFNKFISLLHGAGINTVKNGQEVTLAPMTDAAIKRLSHGAITEPEFLYGKDLKEKKGGFFDPVITGGKFGTHYAHIELPETLPNPVFEKPIRALTGIKSADYDEIIAGIKYVKPDGTLVSAREPGAVTSGKGISRLLEKIDVQKDIALLSSKLKTSKSETELDQTNKKLRYLHALKELKLSPTEAYMRKLIPVVPPIYRPTYEIPERGLMSAAANELYRNMGLLSKSHDYPVMNLLPDHEKAELRSDTYKATRAIAGLEPVLNRGKDHPLEGFISEITSSRPKKSFFINKLLDRRQDLVGRGVVINEPHLDVDELGIPEKMAWNIFRPFLVREYTASGIGADVARREIEEKSPRAKQMLNATMNKRTVLMNRAPSLHKFSIMAFKPKLTQGLAIQVPPLVMKGFNMDVDGDAVTIHVPTSDEAVIESKKMFPSNNLFKPGTGDLMIMPSQESAIGLYFLSQTPEGRKHINALLPEKYHISAPFEAKAAKAFYNKIAREDKNAYHKIVFDLKQLGDKTAYETGFSVKLDDLNVDTKTRDRIFAVADKKAAEMKKKFKPGLELDHHLSDVYRDAAKEAYQAAEAGLKSKNNSFYHMVHSGARGSIGQLQQLIAAPGTVEGAKGKPIPVPLRKSYSEGISTSDYFTSAYGVRKGMMDRALQTSAPGALNKELMASTVDNIITESDCGTRNGIDVLVTDPSAGERFLAKDQHGFKRNTEVTPQLISALTKQGVKTIHVRSPLKCISPKGTCAHCFGIDEHSELPPIGENIGAKAGQAMSEPMTQMVMKCSSGCITDENNITWAFPDFYEAQTSEELDDGHCFSKHGSFHVKDKGELVQSSSIQYHMPDDRMLFIKTKYGHSLVVQANHPLWVYDSEGNSVEKEASLVTTSDYLMTDVSHAVGEEDAPFDPYIIGLFLAEGTTRRGNETNKYKDVPVASIITQRNNSIKKKAWSILKTIEGAKLYDDDIQIYGLSFAKNMSNYVRGREAKLKRFMPGFNLWKNEDLAQVLAGWIDGDGTVFYKNGTTVARIYTCSYYALQQLEIICHKLKISCIPQTVARRTDNKDPRKNQSTQHFCIDLRFRDNSVYTHSIKMQQCEFKETTRVFKDPKYDRVIQIKELWSWTIPVWDIKTISRGYTCGMLRNHNTFHTGGITGESSVAGGFERVQQLLRMREYVAGEAPLAHLDGKVEKVVTTSTGSHDIHIGGEIHKVPPKRALRVAVGSVVKAGDPLSSGVIRPQELVKYKGMQTAQNYIVNELHKVYTDQGIPMHKKVFETIVRSIGNLSKVVRSPKDSEFREGDIIPFTTAVHYNESRAGSLPTSEAAGYHLRHVIGKLPQFHEITDKDIPYIKGMGYNQINVVKDPIIHTPILKGIERLPLEKKNWMAQLGFQRVKDTLTDGAAEAWKTKLEDTHPIPAFAYGATFGKKKEHY